MASIDKIYGTEAQHKELIQWVKENNPSLSNRLYPENKMFNPNMERAISNFSEHEDNWLKENCDIQFVQDRLAEQYSKFNS